MLVFNGRQPQLGLASADFVLEMRAVSMLQRHPRKQALPMRLAHWVTYSGSEEPLRLQPVSDRVPERKHQTVERHMTEYALAWGAWRRNELSPLDYLEFREDVIRVDKGSGSVAHGGGARGRLSRVGPASSRSRSERACASRSHRPGRRWPVGQRGRRA
jgi:hypothetical protein